jgi:hypothetical protein
MYNLSTLTTSTHDLLHHPNFTQHTPVQETCKSGVTYHSDTKSTSENNNEKTNNPSAQAQTNTTTYIPYSAQLYSPRFLKPEPRGHAVELRKDDSWRWCPSCRSTKLCVVIGRCIQSGKRVKVVF